MKKVLFLLVFLASTACSEKVQEKVETPVPPVEIKEVQDRKPSTPAIVENEEAEIPDISNELKKLRKVPGENNGEDGTGDCTGYLDRDGDGYGTDEKTMNFNCSGEAPEGFAKEKGDCNDNSRYVNPGVVETCNGMDDNCDRTIDPENSEGCNRYYNDKDEDGFGTDDFKCLCISEHDYPTLETGDCDDGKKNVHPQARETCNELDDNCNGEIDEGENVTNCRKFYADNDGDGYGSSEKNKCLCKATGDFRADMLGDCNDNNPAIYPGAHEYFDKLDNNCNGIIDENPGVPHSRKNHNKTKE